MRNDWIPSPSRSQPMGDTAPVADPALAPIILAHRRSACTVLATLSRRPGRNHPFDRLPGYCRDPVEIVVVVDHGHAVVLGDCGDDQVGRPGDTAPSRRGRRPSGPTPLPPNRCGRTAAAARGPSAAPVAHTQPGCANSTPPTCICTVYMHCVYAPCVWAAVIASDPAPTQPPKTRQLGARRA